MGVNARNPEFCKKLDNALKSGSLTIVVSSWHLIETANTSKKRDRHRAGGVYRQPKREGKLTEELRQRVDELLVAGSMPNITPAGLDISRDTKMEYFQQARVEAIPSLAIECAISAHEWISQGGEDRNTLIDKFQLISALPCVDEIASDDTFFHRYFRSR